MNIQLHHVTLIVDNIEQAQTFYTEHFGFEAVSKDNLDYGGAFLAINDHQQLHLAELPDAPASFRGHFCMRVSNFNDLFWRFKQLELLDIEAWQKMRELPNGCIQFYLRDPSGNLVEINSFPEDRDLIDPAIFEQPEWGGKPYSYLEQRGPR